MEWNLTPEYLSLVFISILLLYSQKYKLIPTLKNKLFRFILHFIFIEILISILSIIFIRNYQVVPEIVNHAIQLLYLLAAPLGVVLFVYYIIAVVKENDPKIITYFRIATIPYVLYAILVFTNPFTRLLYNLGEPNGFNFGKGFFITYLIAVLYMFAMIIIILVNGKKMEIYFKLSLLSFPVISLIILGIQWIIPTIILAGFAATSALLIIFLYFQNKQVIINEAQKISLYKYEKMISNIADVIGILRADLTIMYTSDNITGFFGWDSTELIGKDSLSLVHPDDLGRVKIAYKELLYHPDQTKEIEIRYMCKDSSYKHVHLSARNMIEDSIINGILINYMDISDRKNMEAEKEATLVSLINNQKLEAIGTLASGVAHEINNPINGVMNYSQLIKDMSDENSEIAEYANEIIYETERVSIIVKSLLQFSRNDKQEYSYARVEDVVNNVTSLIKTIIKSDQIDLKIDVPSDLPKIKCRSQQIQQVLMNLLTNARDTLNEKYPEYNEDKIIKLYCSQYVKEKDKWIRITVEDHGNGIEKSIQPIIFNPFFSTKERHKGTGLGLSVSYGIVKEHHGTLTFETEEKSYTRFYLDLPCDNGWDYEK